MTVSVRVSEKAHTYIMKKVRGRKRSLGRDASFAEVLDEELGLTKS